MKNYNEVHLNILTDAKKVYFNQLNNSIKNTTYEIFYDLYKKSLKESNRKVVEIFKKTLSNIPDWDEDKINSIINKLYNYLTNEKLTNLIRALIVTNTKILASVKMNKNKITSLSLNIPSNHKIHQNTINSMC